MRRIRRARAIAYRDCTGLSVDFFSYEMRMTHVVSRASDL
jgi:hypothetical protein